MELRTIGKYIGTISSERWNEDGIKAVYERLDGHELIVGREVGKSGYHHYQFYMDCAGDLEEYGVSNSLGWHIERAVDGDKAKNYCKKTGNYLYLGDSIEEREYNRIRRRKPLPIWYTIAKHIVSQNDRSITVWIDRMGGAGKSTLLYHLSRRGKCFPIPRSEQSPTRIIDYIAMNYNNEKIIAIDLPRSRKVTVELAEALEDIKDGLIASAKYQGTMKFIRGVKVLVCTNHLIENKAYHSLTRDRWDLIMDGKDEAEGEASR